MAWWSLLEHVWAVNVTSSSVSKHHNSTLNSSSFMSAGRTAMTTLHFGVTGKSNNINMEDMIISDTKQCGSFSGSNDLKSDSISTSLNLLTLINTNRIYTLNLPSFFERRVFSIGLSMLHKELTPHSSAQKAAVERVRCIVSQSTAECYLRLYPSVIYWQIHTFIKPLQRLDPYTYIKACQGLNLCCVGVCTHRQLTHPYTPITSNQTQHTLSKPGDCIL